MGFDEQVVRREKVISELAQQFVLARIVDMRGVDLNVFDFDYDLTWMAFFLNGHEKILGRYGGRDAGNPEAHLSLDGLKHGMARALAAHRADPDARPAAAPEPKRLVDDYPAARRVDRADCIHCHQVYDFQRAALRAEGKWSLDQVWVYPPPRNVGLELDVSRGDLVHAVAPGSAAERTGLAAGDRLVQVGGLPVASFGDVQQALHRAPRAGDLEVAWERGGKTRSALLTLAEGWRTSDLSWRGSLWSLEPSGAVHGTPLAAEEKQELGLDPKHLAFRQGSPLTRQARDAGIREGDIILGLDGKRFEFTGVGQLKAHIRLNYKTGERIAYNIIRGKERLSVTMILPARASW